MKTLMNLATPLRRALLVGLLPWLACLAQAAPESPREHAAVAAIQPVPGEGLQRLSLPWSVLQASRSAGLADVRIFDGLGRVLPMAWARPPAAREQQRTLEVPRFAWPESTAEATSGLGQFQLRLSESGAVLSLQPGSRPAARPSSEARVWLLDLSAVQRATPDQHLSRIELDWPRRTGGLSTEVALEASQDGRQWQSALHAQLLELPPPSDPASTEAPSAALSIKGVDWPAGAVLPRYLRLRFEHALTLSGSKVVMTQRSATPTLQQPVRFEPVAASAGQPAHWALDLQARIAPLALALQLPELNTLLSLRLEQRNTPDETWRPVQRFVAWRMQRDGVESASAAQPLRAEPARYWRLLLDAPAAAVPTALQSQALNAQLHWQVPQLVMLVPSGTNPGLQLAVGRAKATPVALPLESLIPGYRRGDEFKLPTAGLGPLNAQPEPGWLEQLTQPSVESLRRWLLWAVLIAAVAGLGLLARRLLRQIGAPP